MDDRQVKPKKLPIISLAALSDEAFANIQKNVEEYIQHSDDELYHYGTPRHSGRYPWGSGENPYQGDWDFKSHINGLKKKGWTQKEIAESMDMNTSQLRAKIDIASENLTRGRDAMIFKLRDKNYSKMAIARQLQILNPLYEMF